MFSAVKQTNLGYLELGCFGYKLSSQDFLWAFSLLRALKISERVSTSDDSVIKTKNLPSLITSSHLNQDREFFGYADVKIFAYFLNRCNIVANGNRNLKNGT